MFAVRDLLTRTVALTMEACVMALSLATTYVFNTGFICVFACTYVSVLSLLLFFSIQVYCSCAGQSASASLQGATRVNESRTQHPEVALFPLPSFRWSVLADEMVSLHKPRTHWGPRGVKHIWANRLLMSCLHEPLIIAGERKRGRGW